MLLKLDSDLYITTIKFYENSNSPARFMKIYYMILYRERPHEIENDSLSGRFHHNTVDKLNYSK
jgi:hypothetical protein